MQQSLSGARPILLDRAQANGRGTGNRVRLRLPTEQNSTRKRGVLAVIGLGSSEIEGN